MYHFRCRVQNARKKYFIVHKKTFNEMIFKFYNVTIIFSHLKTVAKITCFMSNAKKGDFHFLSG